MSTSSQAPSSSPRESIRFWERGRLLYNAILVLIVLLWLTLTWPHFRPALTLGSLEVLVVLGLLANLCYSAAYLAEVFIRMLTGAVRRRVRIALFILGTLFAIVTANYWIADEIYPYANQPPPPLFGGAMPPAASNMNFPAPLAVVGFLALAGIVVLGVIALCVFWFAHKPKVTRNTGIALASVAVTYLALLLGFSAGSHERVLAQGQEKYFCEIDCHLAYSIVDAKPQPDGRLLITLRTRFDETTTSPSRPKDATLTPSPRDILLVDAAGHSFAPVAIAGTPLLTPLRPADSYTTQLEFNVPADASRLRLLLNTTPAWPDHFVIGDENSLLHKKTYFAL